MGYSGFILIAKVIYYDITDCNRIIRYTIEGGDAMKLTESQTIRHPVSCDTETTVTVNSLIKKAMGTRTITKFCEDSGLSVGFMSRLINGKSKSTPSVRTLAKISFNSASEDTEEMFRSLLNLCGHRLDEQEIQREIRIAKRTSGLLEMERKDAKLEMYGSLNLSASAIGLLFSRLMVMGVSLQPKGIYEPHGGIVFGIRGYEFDRIIAISGFCGNSHQVVMAERDILQQLLRFVSNQTDVPMYLVLTDHKDVYRYVSEILETSVTANAYVLLANKEYTGFAEQWFHAVDEKMHSAPFDFINDKK